MNVKAVDEWVGEEEEFVIEEVLDIIVNNSRQKEGLYISDLQFITVWNVNVLQ